MPGLSVLEERAGCLAFIIFRMSCYCKCSVALPHGAVGWSAVCDCGIYRPYLLTFSNKHVTKCWYERDDDWSWYFKL